MPNAASPVSPLPGAGRPSPLGAAQDRPTGVARLRFLRGPFARPRPSVRRGKLVILTAAGTGPREPAVGKKLYVGNLSWGVNDAQLQELFAPYGTVVSAQVIMDRDTGRSKGFGFVE